MHSERPAGKREKRTPRPLDPARLEELATAYVARFATSAGRLEQYLKRKLRERGWAEEGEPDLAALVARFVQRGYVDDAAYARARAGDLLRRGYGGRRVRQALGQAGVGEPETSAALPDEFAARQAAAHQARKRGFGPWSLSPMPPEKREKAIAAMLRAGHKFDHARAVLDAASESDVLDWVGEAREAEG